MDEIDKDFAEEMISRYGADRFYHSCKRTGSAADAFRLHMQLNGHNGLESAKFLASIGINYMEESIFVFDAGRETMCRIAYGLVRYYKEFALRDHRLPPVLHARMVLGGDNEWVKKYVELLRAFPDWN